MVGRNPFCFTKKGRGGFVAGEKKKKEDRNFSCITKKRRGEQKTGRRRPFEICKRGEGRGKPVPKHVQKKKRKGGKRHLIFIEKKGVVRNRLILPKKGRKVICASPAFRKGGEGKKRGKKEGSFYPSSEGRGRVDDHQSASCALKEKGKRRLSSSPGGGGERGECKILSPPPWGREC